MLVGVKSARPACAGRRGRGYLRLINMTNQIAIFRGKQIRKTIHNNEWWFSVIDVCEVLTESTDAGAYWRKLKQRLIEEKSEVVTFCHGLKLEAPDGKMRETDCANTEGIFRIIQSIPSPKAEPFKKWLARVGYERIQEIENPELATKRTDVIASDRRERSNLWLNNLYDRKQKLFCLYQCQ